MAAATPISPHHDRCKGGEISEGEDLTNPPGARRRKRPDAAGLWQAPAQAGRWPAPRPEHGRFPGQAALRKPPGTHRRTRPAPKMPPEHHPHAPFGKGRQKSRQKEYIDIVGKKFCTYRHIYYAGAFMISDNNIDIMKNRRDYAICFMIAKDWEVHMPIFAYHVSQFRF